MQAIMCFEIYTYNFHLYYRHIEKQLILLTNIWKRHLIHLEV